MVRRSLARASMAAPSSPSTLPPRYGIRQSQADFPRPTAQIQDDLTVRSGVRVGGEQVQDVLGEGGLARVWVRNDREVAPPGHGLG